MPQNGEMQLNSNDSDAICRVAGCSIGLSITPSRLRIHGMVHLLTYLFTYLHSWLGEYKNPAISLKWLKINNMYKVVQGLSLAAKVYDLE